MTKLAKLIAHEEGYGAPDAIPTRRRNPGDLRHSPHSKHPGGPEHANDVGTIDTIEHGWEDLERQLRLYAERLMDADHKLSALAEIYAGPHKMTLREMVYTYAPPSDHNRTDVYLRDVCAGLMLSPESTVAFALTIPA